MSLQDYIAISTSNAREATDGHRTSTGDNASSRDLDTAEIGDVAPANPTSTSRSRR